MADIPLNLQVKLSELQPATAAHAFVFTRFGQEINVVVAQLNIPLTSQAVRQANQMKKQNPNAEQAGIDAPAITIGNYSLTIQAFADLRERVNIFAESLERSGITLPKVRVD